MPTKQDNFSQMQQLTARIAHLKEHQNNLSSEITFLEKSLSLRQKFHDHFICTDAHGKTYIDENNFFFGTNKITPEEFNLLMQLLPPIKVDYMLRNQQTKSLVSQVFSYRLSIEKTMAFWLLLAASLFFMAPKDKVFLPSLYGFFSWFLIEQGYHRLGHLSVNSESKMHFIYGLHWKHHMEPDRPGNTVSPPVKNMVLAAAVFFLFSMMELPNPVLAMAVLTVQFTFYEFMHWLAHTKRANDFVGVPLVGKIIANIIGHHRAHHTLGDRYAISSGSLFSKIVGYCANISGVGNVAASDKPYEHSLS